MVRARAGGGGFVHCDALQKVEAPVIGSYRL